MTFKLLKGDSKHKLPTETLSASQLFISHSYIINVTLQLTQFNSLLCVTFSGILWVKLQGSRAQALPPTEFWQCWSQWKSISITGEDAKKLNEDSHVCTPLCIHTHTHTEHRYSPASTCATSGEISPLKWKENGCGNEPLQNWLWSGPIHLPSPARSRTSAGQTLEACGLMHPSSIFYPGVHGTATSWLHSGSTPTPPQGLPAN